MDDPVNKYIAARTPQPNRAVRRAHGDRNRSGLIRTSTGRPDWFRVMKEQAHMRETLKEYRTYVESSLREQTKAELMAELDTAGIPYAKRWTKDQMIQALMAEATK